MSKAKDVIADIRDKVFERRKQETIEKAQEVLEKNLDNTVYDVIQNPNSKSRDFLIVKIKYDLETKEAAVLEVREFQDKAAGLTIQIDKENRKYLFNKNKKGEKK